MEEYSAPEVLQKLVSFNRKINQNKTQTLKNWIATNVYQNYEVSPILICFCSNLFISSKLPHHNNHNSRTKHLPFLYFVMLICKLMHTDLFLCINNCLSETQTNKKRQQKQISDKAGILHLTVGLRRTQAKQNNNTKKEICFSLLL